MFRTAQRLLKTGRGGVTQAMKRTYTSWVSRGYGRRARPRNKIVPARFRPKLRWGKKLRILRNRAMHRMNPNVDARKFTKQAEHLFTVKKPRKWLDPKLGGRTHVPFYWQRDEELIRLVHGMGVADGRQWILENAVRPAVDKVTAEREYRVLDENLAHFPLVALPLRERVIAAVEKTMRQKIPHMHKQKIESVSHILDWYETRIKIAKPATVTNQIPEDVDKFLRAYNHMKGKDGSCLGRRSRHETKTNSLPYDHLDWHEEKFPTKNKKMRKPPVWKRVSHEYYHL
eukprot:TRINITY_DN67905_c3_g1_i1.p1 TRINITY_DN67905_c3_g1~~TRINITY_DN67905_c3_g1_i1.p1  ORF type:complete len:286 (-),score=4.29 TRINITY_DN67905_c3_g1_i1:118-975(-)